MKAVLLALAGLWALPVSAADLALETLEGTKVDLAPSTRPTVLVFWRADCAPCRIELRQAADYVSAAAPGRVLFVGLQERTALRAAAAKARLPVGQVLRATGAPAAVLTAFGGAPPSLPLAVALDKDGRICARQSGLLGTELIQKWVQICGDDHAVD
jgi:thiol-disulfide isomerase/thioredoxin